jgi:hypothetical protein
MCTEQTECTFIVNEVGDDNRLSIAVEATKVSGTLFVFDVKPGMPLEGARDLARQLRKAVQSVSVRCT